MELRHLRTFLVAAETLSISAAARKLRVTQPALSRQIRELEHAVGHPVFVRHTGGLRLTPAGSLLQDRGGKALRALDDALREARGESERAPAVLRIGYYGTMSVWANLIAPALDRMGSRFPETTYSMIELTCGQLVTELREGRLDVAVLGPGIYPAMPRVNLAVICQFPAMVLAPVNHRLAKKRQIGLQELRDEEIISLTPESSPGRDHAFIAACKAAGFTPRITHFGTGMQEAIPIGIKRMGVGIVGNFAKNSPYPGVVYIKLKPPGILLDLHAAHVQGNAAAAHLCELIGAEARRVVGRT